MSASILFKINHSLQTASDKYQMESLASVECKASAG